MRVLVIRGSAIGDIIECLPVVSALKKFLDEDCEVHWLVRRKFKKVLEGNRFIDRVLCFEDYKDIQFRIVKRIYRRKNNLDGLEGWLRFSCVNKLKENDYDLVINLHEKLDARMFSVMSGADKIITAPWLDAEDTVYDSNDHRIVENLKALNLLNVNFDVDCFVKDDIDYGWSFSEDEVAKTSNILRDNDCKDNGYIVFVLSTTWQSKNYPVENWIKLTKMLVEYRKKIVFIGDSKDSSLFNKIKEKVKNDYMVDLTGRTSLREMIIVLSKASVVVGGDTGPMHIAASLGINTVTVMNPTFPDKYAPYGMKGVVLTSDYPCRNCHMVKCPKGVCCMKYIAPQRVLEAIMKFFYDV